MAGLWAVAHGVGEETRRRLALTLGGCTAGIAGTPGPSSEYAPLGGRPSPGCLLCVLSSSSPAPSRAHPGYPGGIHPHLGGAGSVRPGRTPRGTGFRSQCSPVCPGLGSRTRRDLPPRGHPSPNCCGRAVPPELGIPGDALVGALWHLLSANAFGIKPFLSHGCRLVL